MSRSSTSSSDVRAARRFCIRALLFVGPLILLLLPVEFLLYQSGETLPSASAAQRQVEDEKTLYGRALLSQQYNVYKLAAMELRVPQVLIAGSSRALQIRASMFQPRGEEVYNGGGLLRDLEDLEVLTDRLVDQPHLRPRFLLAAIDPWWLRRGGHHPTSWLRPPHTNDEAFSAVAHVTVLRQLLARPSWLLEAGSGHPQGGALTLIGLGAWRGDGFRADGSYRYGRYLSDFEANPVYMDREEPPVVERIRNRTRQFVPTDGLDPGRVARLTVALQRIAALGIEVGVLFPPLARECALAAEADPTLWAWLEAAYVGVASMLRESGFAVVSSVSAEPYGLDDRHFFDGFHPGEVVMGHMVADLIDASGPESYLAGIPTEELRKRLRTAASPLSLASFTRVR